MPTLDERLKSDPDRCSGCGYHPPTQGCRCPGSDREIFRRALRQAVRPDGTVHACDVRPLVRDRIEPKHIATQWRTARQDGLIEEIGHERSDDTRGKNAGRMEPYYLLIA